MLVAFLKEYSGRLPLVSLVKHRASVLVAEAEKST